MDQEYNEPAAAGDFVLHNKTDQCKNHSTVADAVYQTVEPWF